MDKNSKKKIRGKKNEKKKNIILCILLYLAVIFKKYII